MQLLYLYQRMQNSRHIQMILVRYFSKLAKLHIIHENRIFLSMDDVEVAAFLCHYPVVKVPVYHVQRLQVRVEALDNTNNLLRSIKDA